MKRILILGIAIVLAGCMIDMPNSAGSVVITFPSRASIATDLAGVELDYTVARVWLTSGSTRINVGGLEYVESDGESVTISGLRPDVYAVQVSFGQSDDGILHTVEAYGKSASFTISAGITSNATVKLLPQIVFNNVDTIGIQYVDVVAIGSDVYTLAADGTLFKNGVPFTDAVLTGKRIQSITRGAFFDTASTLIEELWINTDLGIYPLRGGSIVEDFSTALSIGASGLDIESTFYYLSENPDYPTENALVIFAQGSGLDSIVGTYITYASSGAPSSWEWHGWDAIDGIAGLGAIKDALTGVGEVVYDLKFDSRFVIAATALQTLLLPKENLNELIDYMVALDDPAADMNLEEVLSFFYIVSLTTPDGQGKTIKSVEIEDTYLYLGTSTANDPENGVFVAQIDAATGVLLSDALLIPETKGLAIREIGYDPTVGLTFVRADNMLFVLESGVLVTEVPAYAGLPGTLLDAGWDSFASRIYLAGTEGISYLVF